MVYTVTLNPSLDYVMCVDDIELGNVNRSQNEYILPGGKGINVSIVLSNLGIENTVFGFIAGFTGKEIKMMLEEQGCLVDFIAVEGNSRINVKIKSKDETDVNGNGPCIDDKSLEELFNKLDNVNENDILVLAGSVQKSLPDNIYERILERLSGRNIKFIVDTTGQALINTLKYEPFLVKPNKQEIEELFSSKTSTNDDIVNLAKKLVDMGARNVLVSLAADGAILVTETGKVFFSKAPDGKVVNSVGAGDSMVAGFIAGYLESEDLEEAFRMGLSAGSASAFSMYLARKNEIEEVYERGMAELWKN